MQDHDRGAYGFRLIYPDWADAYHDLVELDSSSPGVTIDWRLASPTRTFEHVEVDRVALGAKDASAFVVQRTPPSITFDLDVAPSPDALLHPLATIPLSVLARWRGDVTLHAGGFVAESTAWAVAGVRRAGKSTTLAILAELGVPIVADDLLTVQGGKVHAGPHCVDLRSDVAGRFRGVRNLGFVGQRERHRVPAPAAPATAPLGGLFLLEWDGAPDVTVEPLTSQERVEWLYRLEYIGLLGAADPRALLDLAVLPAWRVTRPTDWAAAEDAAGQILAIARLHSGERQQTSVP